MRGITRLIQQRLENIYPLTEINAFTKIILKDIFGFNLIDLYLDKDINFTDKQQEKLNSILDRLENHEPIQYVLGTVDFYGLKLNVAPGVLIPRPETEELVDIIVYENSKFMGEILDIGTGSGCIALALSSSLKNSTVTAFDISEEALKIARENGAKLGLEVDFRKVDILKEESLSEKYNIIISNPPYVTEEEKKGMESNVLKWEPEIALFVPDEDPLLYYRIIAEKGREILHENGLIYYEINHLFGGEMKVMLEELGYKSVEIMKDMSGCDRFIKAGK